MAESDNRDDEKRLECPVCLDFFEKPIRQCVIGHSFCGKCMDPLDVKICPECRSQVLETRNYKLEELMDAVALPCIFKKAGCPFQFNKEDMAKHILECKFRVLKCEGKLFCDWKCNWSGHDILKHFKEKHEKNANMEYATTATLPYNEENKFSDIHIISAHYQLFWLKHKIDLEKKKAYWAIQFIGPRKNASYYYYEFEIYNEKDPIKKFKITEYCTSDTEDIETVFKTEKCVAVSFTMLKNHVNEKGLYSFRFRLMKIPNPVKVSKDKEKVKSEVRTKSPDKRAPQGYIYPRQYDAHGPIWLPLMQQCTANPHSRPINAKPHIRRNK